MWAISIIIQGIVTGVVLTMSFGVGFFALIQTSINKGYKKGLLIACGALLSDFLFIVLSLFATSFVADELPKYNLIIRWVALVAFIGLGVWTILKSGRVLKYGDTSDHPNFFYVSKGFLLNLINPLVLISWLGIAVLLQSSFNYNFIELFLYFSFVLIATFASQVFICLFSHKIKSYLSDVFIHRLNIVVGIVFIVLGIVLFFQQGSAEGSIEKAKEILQ